MRYPEETPDAELVAAFVGGDARAFDAIVDRYERRVYAVALRMCSSPDEALDISQEVFISALRSLKRFRGDAKLSTWFHRVTVNAALDQGRKKQRRHTQPLEAAPDSASPQPGPEEHALATARAAEVQRALSDISPEHRAVVVLHDLQGLDYAEVAEALGVPLGTIKSRLHRARTELAKRLGHLREPEPSALPRPLTEEP
jgi:RNA polymerase sigma-70 factor (ECF subfamily)